MLQCARLKQHPGSILHTWHHVVNALAMRALPGQTCALPAHLGSRLLAQHHVRQAWAPQRMQGTFPDPCSQAHGTVGKIQACDVA